MFVIKEDRHAHVGREHVLGRVHVGDADRDQGDEVRQREAEARAIEALRLTGQQYDILEAIQLSQITLGMLDGESGITITGPDTGTGLIQAPSTPSSPSTRVSTTTTTTGPGGGGGG
jgi:hypothetical protein